MATPAPQFQPRAPRRRSAPVGCILGILQWFLDLTRFWIYILLFFALVALGSYAVVSHYVRGKELEAPDLSKLTVDEALKRLSTDPLKKYRLSLSLERSQPHESARKDTIISQQPEPKSRIKAGSPIKIVLSEGPPLVTVPDLRGQSRERAATLLRRYNLQMGNEAFLDQPGRPGGLIITTDPPGGSGIVEGGRVNLLMTAGANQSNLMPDLVGLTLEEVRETLAARKLTPAETIARPMGGDAQPGQVVDQMPKAGQVLQGDTHIVVYYEPEVTPLPEATPPPETDSGTAPPEVDDLDPRNSPAAAQPTATPAEPDTQPAAPTAPAEAAEPEHPVVPAATAAPAPGAPPAPAGDDAMPLPAPE